MPIDPEQLLDLARRLVGPDPNSPEADLRRSISTAYYALFHLLIKETVSRFIADVTIQPKVSRVFQHGSIRKVCDRYNLKPDKKTGEFVTQEANGFPSQIIAPGVRAIARTFSELHQLRELADYDDAETIRHSAALVAVEQVEEAFQVWLEVQSDPSAVTFLRELFCQSIGKR